MDPASKLKASTAMHFDLINFAELNEVWIDEVIDSEFTDAEENNITVNILFVNDAISALTQLANICSDWNKIDEDDASRCSNISNQDILWTFLDEMEINVKQIQGLIYLLCFKAVKSTSLQEEKKLGLCSARLYFNALRVPGSGAYAVFHPNLFKLCIDCLPAPDFTTDKSCMSLKDFDKLISVYVPSLISAISLLRDFYLGDDSNTIEHVIKKMVELCACEIQNSIKFDVDYANLSDRELMRCKSTFIVSALAYQSLFAILDTNLNGDQDQNYVTILSYLNKHILCLKAKRSQTISHKLQVIKDNAISFICHNLATKEEFASEVTQIALKRLCLGVNDKAEFRSTVSNAIVNILYKLKIEHIVLMIQWLLLLIDSVDTKDRVFALEVLGLLLDKPFQINDIDLSDSLKVYLTEVPIIFAILTRCDDTSSVVRTRALTVVSQNMRCILQFLYKTKDQKTFETEISEEIREQDMDVNGNHRFFWYNLTSLRERLNEIASILQRRIGDNNVTARKAAFIALENLMVFDRTYLNAENLKYFTFAVKDANIVVRKQMIQSLSFVLSTYYNHPETQACWLKCILPLVQDPESTVQSKAVSELEEQFLCRIFTASENDQFCAFNLLKLLASGEFLSHQRYFQKAFNIWKSEKKLKSQDIHQLEKYLDSEWEESVLFFLSNFAAYCSLPSKTSHLYMEQFEKYESNKSFPDYMDYLLKVLIHVSKNISDDKLIAVKNVITNSLKSFDVSVRWIPMYIELLLKIHKHLKTETEFATISFELIQQCEKQFSAIKASNTFQGYSEELLSKYICLTKELCHIDSSKISKNLVSSLKAFSGCDDLPTAFSGITPNLRAHAFAALGKICLQDEILAKKLLDIYATELLSSKHDVIRNNLVIILIEMCKRYTSFADKYVPLISLCFKDQLYLIRYQTIVMLVNLLQEGYIKWRGPLFFCLLSTLNDKKDEIQELGRYSLTQLLQDKKKSLFSEHFIDSIFVFSGFPPPDNETLSQIVKDLDRFALKGEIHREQRLHLYKFLLESMEMKERAYLVKSVCEILMNVAEAVYPLNEMTEGIIRDCFAILTCKEIRTVNIEQLSDDIEDTEEKDLFKTELETRRIVIVEPVIPVIISLRNSFTDPSSDLMQDIIIFLKELFHDFKDIMKDLLSIDRVLLRQLELEIRNDAERERNEKRLEKDSRHRNKISSSNNQGEAEIEDSINIQGIQMMMNNVMVGMENDERREKCNGNDSATSEQILNVLTNVSKPTKSQSIDASSGSSTSNSTIKSYNIVSSTPAEAKDIQLFSSTPRVMLTAVKLPPGSTVLNMSAIECSEPMEVDVSDNTI